MGKLKQKKPAKKRSDKERFESLLDEAEAAMAKFEYEQACLKYEAALGIFPKNTDVMDTLGEVLVTFVGNEEKGEAVLRKSIELAPNDGHSKYMSLGQMMGGAEGLLMYKKGAENLLKNLNEATDPAEREEISEQMASSFCAVAELWTTDLCMEEGAEHQCKAALDFAALHSPNNAEMHALYAQLYLRLNKMEESKASLLKVCNLLEILPDTRQPSTETKIEVGKLLMQVSEWDEAYQLFKSLLLADDGNGYLWYLMGETLKYLGNFRRSQRHLLRAKGIAERVAGTSDEQGEDGPAAFLAKIDELLLEVGAKLTQQDLAKNESGWVTDSDDEEDIAVAKQAEEELRKTLPKGDVEMS
eukprot:TRINITY_DN1418_c1_g1_i2.p1 TRINITY_DN1418_c1_g1~~TRINITY_DN1418_c1_g1_i2.p1  ORF type:complete len:377 (+),score=107.37 TRINITY_DN1418_c1_g1_i2:59-1132(+)